MAGKGYGEEYGRRGGRDWEGEEGEKEKREIGRREGPKRKTEGSWKWLNMEEGKETEGGIREKDERERERERWIKERKRKEKDRKETTKYWKEKLEWNDENNENKLEELDTEVKGKTKYTEMETSSRRTKV